MKHLNKFYDYLNESTSLNKDEIEENLLNLKDLASSTISVKVDYYAKCEYKDILTSMYYITLAHRYLPSDRVTYYKSASDFDYNFFRFDITFYDILNELVNIKYRLADKYDIGIKFEVHDILLCIIEK